MGVTRGMRVTLACRSNSPLQQAVLLGIEGPSHGLEGKFVLLPMEPSILPCAGSEHSAGRHEGENVTSQRAVTFKVRDDFRLNLNIARTYHLRHQPPHRSLARMDFRRQGPHAEGTANSHLSDPYAGGLRFAPPKAIDRTSSIAATSGRKCEWFTAGVTVRFP